MCRILGAYFLAHSAFVFLCVIAIYKITFLSRLQVFLCTKMLSVLLLLFLRNLL